MILSDLREIILSLDLPAGRTDKILSAIPRCLDQTHELCNQDCPYWSVCGDEDITYLFNDIHALLKEEGVCD